MNTLDTAQIESYISRLRSAYHQIAPQTGAWISLSELRAQIGGNRQYVDAALVLLGRQRGVVIAPEANQKTLSDWDRECALWVGGQWKHIISIA